MTQTRLIVAATVFSFMLLMGCQSNQQKAQDDLQAEALALGWTQLQQNTLTHLQEKSFGEAEINVKQMMAVAGEEHERWEYIRMALVSMPQDIAVNLVEQALDQPYVAGSVAQQFAFSRVLTQLQEEQLALDLVNQVIRQDKQAEYVYWRARLLLLLEQESAAEQDYQWLLKQDGNNATYISQYATLLNYLERPDEALQLLAAHEEDADLLYRQIIIMLQQGKQDQAEVKYQLLKNKLMDAEELTDQRRLDMGELAYWLKDHEASLQWLQAVKAGNLINEAKLLMGSVLVDQHAYDRAKVLFRQVQNGPEDNAIPAYMMEMEIHIQQEDYPTALEIANGGLRMFRDDSGLLYSRAMIFEKMDDIASLEKDLMTILKNEPDNADALNALGYTWADHDMNLDQAYDYVMQAYAIKPGDKAILDSVGWVYYKKGDIEQAEKYLRLAIEGNDRDVESYLHLIEVLEVKGDLAAAEAIRQQASVLFPETEF